eukprot:TRINITY_DN1288_c0_g1_i1.p1 TRINITY_DN1288_c0_g1~~TRINITY_DN1288_c0_g1_i1.p1  ORF type:complete len:270 (-),score=43.27 TRINITY_DN1288_c0_g1_i1:114-923(-)
MENSIVSIRVATYNIRNTTDRYSERVDLLKQTILDQKADIMGLQEVAFGTHDQLDQLSRDADNKPLYKGIPAESQLKFHEIFELASDFRIDGNAILVNEAASKFEILKHETVHLSHIRVAQRLLIAVGEKKVWFVNVHLHHVIEDEWVRVHQVEGLLLWLKGAVKEGDSVIIGGDFNATPDSATYKLLKKYGFQSAYALLNDGKEPEKTFPTGLQAPFIDTDPPGTFDYLFIKGPITAKSVTIFGNKCKSDDPTIYPSDHYGLTADLAL